MKGSTFKRCTCPAEFDAAGKKKTCRKAHGSWSFVADTGIDPATGKRRQVKRGGFRTQGDAEQALSELLAQVGTGQYVHDDGATVATWLQMWLDERLKMGIIRASTGTSYQGHMDHHLIPHLGRYRLRDLRPGHISKMLLAIEDGRSGTTVRRIHGTLRSALSSAVKRGLISYNPARSVELPKASRPKVRPWEPAELGAFLDAAARHPLGIFFETVAATGLRRGEACGVRREDLDLQARTITVRQQICQVDKKRSGQQPDCPICGERHAGIAFGKPKTASGEDRVVDLDERTVGALMLHLLAQDAERDEWGEAYRDHGLLFARPGGDPLKPGDMTDLFAELVAESGLRKIRLHDLRHGQASLMLAAGVPMAVVSKRLGHSSLAITADTYSHLLAGVGRDAADRAAGLVPRASRDQSVTSQAAKAESPAAAVGPENEKDPGQQPDQSLSLGGARGTRTHNPRVKSQHPDVSGDDAR